MLLRELFEINQLDSKSYDTLIDWQVEIASILADEDPENVYEWHISRVEDIYEDFLKEVKIQHQPTEELVFDDFSLHAIPFTQLTLGAYIDLEYYSADSTSMAKGLSVLYRQIVKEEDNLNPPTYEDYGDWVDHRSRLFLDLEVSKVMGQWTEWLRWRSSIMETYQGLFDTYQGEDDIEELDAKSKAELEKIKKEEAQAKAFAWEKTILKLCNDDASRFEDILSLPVLLVFNILGSKK